MNTQQEQKKIIAYMVIKLFPYCGHHLGKILHQHRKYLFYAMWPEYFQPIYEVEQEPEVSQEEKTWSENEVERLVEYLVPGMNSMVLISDFKQLTRKTTP